MPGYRLDPSFLEDLAILPVFTQTMQNALNSVPGVQVNQLSELYFVTGVPSSTLGVNGDFALRQDVPTLYGKASGFWTSIAGTTSPLNPPVTITNTAPASVPLTIVGAASQTADLLDLKNNAGTTLYSIDASGDHTLNGQSTTTSVLTVNAPANQTQSTVFIQSGTGQTGDIFRVASTGTAFHGVTANGTTYAQGAASQSNTTFQATAGTSQTGAVIDVRSSSASLLSVQPNGAIYVGNAPGSSGQVLTSAGSAASPTWSNAVGFANPMTAPADMIYGSVSTDIALGVVGTNPFGGGSNFANATDGNDSTFFQSGTGSAQHRIYLDLGAAHAITQFRVLADGTKPYQLHASTDNFASSDVVIATLTATPNDSGYQTIASSNYRYWALIPTAGDGGGDSAWKIYTFSLYGSAVGTATRLAAGTSGQVLVTQGTSAAPQWTTVTSLTGSQMNEAAASILTNATSTGDAGGRSDHFPGSALNVKWTEEVAATSKVVGNSSFGILSASPSIYTQPYTPSGAFRIEARFLCALQGQAGSFGLYVKTSGSGDTGDGVLATIENNAGGIQLDVYTLDSGTLTSRVTSSIQSASSFPAWIYIALARDGSNNWTASWSGDRSLWISPSSVSKTITVAKLGLRGSGSLHYSADFVDVVS